MSAYRTSDIKFPERSCMSSTRKSMCRKRDLTCTVGVKKSCRFRFVLHQLNGIRIPVLAPCNGHGNDPRAYEERRRADTHCLRMRWGPQKNVGHWTSLHMFLYIPCGTLPWRSGACASSVYQAPSFLRWAR